MGRSRQGWHTLFCRQLNCDPAFARVLEEQLVARAAGEAEVDPRAGGFFLVPPAARGAVRYDVENTGYVATDLVGPDAFGPPVTIAWRCETHPDEPLDPAHAAGCRPRIWWQALPTEDIRRRYAKPIAPPVALPADLPFAIEWWPGAWPDVLLELHLRDPDAGERGARLEAILNRAAAEWNARSAGRGTIAFVGAVERASDTRLRVAIDFGSAAPPALVALLEAFRQLGADSPLRRVIVR